VVVESRVYKESLSKLAGYPKLQEIRERIRKAVRDPLRFQAFDGSGVRVVPIAAPKGVPELRAYFHRASMEKVELLDIHKIEPNN